MTGLRAHAALSVNGLGKIFQANAKSPPIPALDDISFETQPGKVTGLVGPDGAGKTTLLRIAAGLLTPTSGSVSVLGEDIAHDVEAIQQRIGYMPQKFGLYQDLSVMENLELFADLRGVSKPELDERFPRLMKMTGLEPFTARLAGKLSGGMKQKLGLACSLIRSPELLLLDEPTVGVDPVSRRELWSIVYDLVREHGISVLVSTAYLDEAERCDKIVVLYEGKKLAEGDPASFRDRVRGRTYVIRASAARPRELQSRLVELDAVVDATIRSGRVRTVLVDSSSETLRRSLQGLGQFDIDQVEPVFEDAFLAMLPGRHKHVVGQYAELSSAGEKPTTEAAVEVRHLSKRFGEFTAVNDLSFDVRRGEIFGLLGPNGAGKSTTFRMLCGLLKPTDGKLNVAGMDLRHAPSKARSRLGYMAQQFSLYGPLSVRENLLFFGRVYGIPRDALKERIEDALEEFGLEERQNETAGDLPAGFKQRLAMAAALLHRPDILFLDEPTSGVDPLARREFWLRINRVAQSGVTVIVTTHFMEEAEYCDRMMIIVQGKELATGTPDEIRRLARSRTVEEPTIEDAFIYLAERQQQS
ncbi:MAG: ATP-binding cassette domain-containing protein [Bdellovibrionota bacterium]